MHWLLPLSFVVLCTGIISVNGAEDPIRVQRQLNFDFPPPRPQQRPLSGSRHPSSAPVFRLPPSSSSLESQRPSAQTVGSRQFRPSLGSEEEDDGSAPPPPPPQRFVPQSRPSFRPDTQSSFRPQQSFAQQDIDDTRGGGSGKEEEGESKKKEEPDRLSQLLQNSKFDCSAKKAGYYADDGLNCEVFHYCNEGVRHSWMCPVGTSFHQIHLICMQEGGDNICQQSTKFHFVNDYLYKPISDGTKHPNGTIKYADRYFPDEAIPLEEQHQSINGNFRPSHHSQQGLRNSGNFQSIGGLGGGRFQGSAPPPPAPRPAFGGPAPFRGSGSGSVEDEEDDGSNGRFSNNVPPPSRSFSRPPVFGGQSFLPAQSTIPQRAPVAARPTSSFPVFPTNAVPTRLPPRFQSSSDDRFAFGGSRAVPLRSAEEAGVSGEEPEEDNRFSGRPVPSSRPSSISNRRPVSHFG